MIIRKQISIGSSSNHIWYDMIHDMFVGSKYLLLIEKEKQKKNQLATHSIMYYIQEKRYKRKQKICNKAEVHKGS